MSKSEAGYGSDHQTLCDAVSACFCRPVSLVGILADDLIDDERLATYVGKWTRELADAYCVASVTIHRSKTSYSGARAKLTGHPPGLAGWSFSSYCELAANQAHGVLAVVSDVSGLKLAALRSWNPTPQEFVRLKEQRHRISIVEPLDIGRLEQEARRELDFAASDGQEVGEAGKKKREKPADDGNARICSTSSDQKTPNESAVAPKTQWNLWGLGMEAENKWHLFRRSGGDWQIRRVVELSKGRQAKLMKALVERGGLLAKTDALILERATYSASDVDRLMGLITPEISKIRKILRRAIGTKDPKADPLPFVGDATGWQAAIRLGYAVQEDRDFVGGEYRLRFKTKEELDPDERADR